MTHGTRRGMWGNTLTNTLPVTYSNCIQNMRLCHYGKLLCAVEGSALNSVIKVDWPLSVIMCEPSCIAALSVIDLKNTNTQADEVLFCLFPTQRNDLHGCHNLNQPGTGGSSTAAKYLPEYSCSAVILLVFVTFSVSSHLSNCSVRSISIIACWKKRSSL